MPPKLRRRRRKFQASPRAEDMEMITGRWKVVKVYYEPKNPVSPLPRPPSPTGSADDSESEDWVRPQMVNLAGPDFKGVELVMDDQCDITWVVPKGVEPTPLFQTSSFFMEKDTIDFIGEQYKVFTFSVEVGTYEKGQESLLLSCYSDALDGTMFMQINKVKTPAQLPAEHFSLKSALEEGFFSDLTIRSAEGQQFYVHRAVLSCCCPGMKYRDWEVFLSSLPAPLLQAALCYVYTDCLPLELMVPQAQELLAAAGGDPRLATLAQLCKVFVDNHNLKLRLMQLIDDIQAGLELARKIVDATEMSNPVKITYAAKQLAKEGAAVATKFCLLCELYSRNKKELSKLEKQELLEYCRGRVVVFVDQLRELLELALAKWDSLTEAQRAETAQHIIPEVERIWDLVLASCQDIKSTMSSKGSSSSSSSGSIRRTFSHLERGELRIALALQFMNRGKELRRLEKIGKEFDEFMEDAGRKREEWKEWTQDQRATKVARGLHWAFTEGEDDLEKLEELKKEILVENALEWKKFKILVTMACSYVSWGLRRLLSLKDPLRPILLKACKFVQRKDVNETLVFLGLLEKGDLVGLMEEDGDESGADKEGGGDKQEELPAAQAGLELPLVRNSELASGCQQLLESQELCDMQFILMPQEATPTNGDEAPPTGKDGLVIPAHRVIVAARSEWFRRALQSGMKEAIDRKIIIYGVEEGVFGRFLRFLYGAAVEPDSMALEELVDLLAVADRFETPTLRALCEVLLVCRVEDSTVFLLLEVADRYSTRRLREATLHYILGSPDVIIDEVEGYSTLPQELQQEIRTLLSAAGDPQLVLRHQAIPTTPTPTTPTPTTQVEVSEPVRPRRHSTNSSGSSRRSSQGYEDYEVAEGVTAFETALAELKGVVPEASDEVLRDLLLAADCDVNRALNYYFGAS